MIDRRVPILVLLVSLGCERGSELSIMEIQGRGSASPYRGRIVETSGVVTLAARDGSGFWIQDPEGDGRAATSDGLFVRAAPEHPPGARLRLVARVAEESRGVDLSRTELRDVLRVELDSPGLPLPAPVRLEDLPDESIEEAIRFWEPLEGMLVSVAGAPVVGPTHRFGEFAILAPGDARPGSGFFEDPGQIFLRALGAQRVDYNPERILVGDAVRETPSVGPGDLLPRVGGVVDYTFGNYKIQAAEWEIRIAPRDAAPPARTAPVPAGPLALATFNVENLFDRIDAPDRADTMPSIRDLEVKLDKLVRALRDELRLPEILVVQEVENTAILAELGDRVNAVAGTRYTASSFDSSDPRGIENGFLWDAGRVELREAFLLSGSDVAAAFGPRSPGPGREPLVGIFERGASRLVVVGNHFKSKRGDDPLFGMHQPPRRPTERQRKAQARAVRRYASALLEENHDAFLVIAGDLNDFPFGEPGEGADHPLAILEGKAGEAPLANLIDRVPPPERYTYIFDGNSQVLDHLLVSQRLLERVRSVDILHFNAALPERFRGDARTPFRVSDHDPLVARFDLR